MKNEKGITLLALAITLTVMAIIGLTVFYTAEGLDTEVEDDVLIAELETVHHIVLQEWNKKLTLGDKYVLKGTVLSNADDLENHRIKLEIKRFKTTYDKYYILTSEQLNQIGAKNVTSETEYLVCYETGEVANIKHYKTRGENSESLYTK